MICHSWIFLLMTYHQYCIPASSSPMQVHMWVYECRNSSIRFELIFSPGQSSIMRVSNPCSRIGNMGLPSASPISKQPLSVCPPSVFPHLFPLTAICARWVLPLPFSPFMSFAVTYALGFYSSVISPSRPPSISPGPCGPLHSRQEKSKRGRSPFILLST